ncbi:MAG: baseplate J/gp47 family protein [Burkholderiales bacterium]|nr:baseplate J/gp47 family protein [Burkholderiales bacterium]
MSTQTLIDLSTLPAPSVIEAISFESILADIKTQFLSLHPAGADVIELESEPIAKLLECIAFRELSLRARYNDDARSVMLAFSTGADLDHIGATYYQEARLLISAADDDAIPPVPAVMEADDTYRHRLALKSESYSVAGPRGAYEFHARSASGQVKSVSVTSPIRGTTHIHVLTHTGSGLPDAPLLALVDAAVNAETIRPLSEDVVVLAATIIEYTIDIDLTLFAGASTEPALAAARAALERFSIDHHQLETDIVHSAIDAAAHVAGVKKVVIKSPAADIDTGPSEAPYCTAITINIAAIE